VGQSEFRKIGVEGNVLYVSATLSVWLYHTAEWYCCAIDEGQRSAENSVLGGL
jgi:hypothetical protein